jgi:uncharacterized protein YndB with AHSA1/START domain
MEPIRIETDLPLGRDRVWDLWTTAAGLATWLGARAVVEPVVGGRFEIFWNPDPASPPDSDSTIGCRILSIDRPRLLRFTWRGSDAVADVMNVPGAPVTEVEVAMSPTLDGTRLVMTHSGWADGPGWRRAREWFARAWGYAFENLRRCGE